MKTTFTTGEVAKVLAISQQTVIKLIDSGQLPGYRVPLSKFRRVSYQSLVAWLRAHPEYEHAWTVLGLVDDQSVDTALLPTEDCVAEKVNYTTGDLSKLLNFAPRTISKLIDAGELRGYRFGVAGSDRRVNHTSLAEFLARNPGLSFCLERLVKPHKPL